MKSKITDPINAPMYQLIMTIGCRSGSVVKCHSWIRIKGVAIPQAMCVPLMNTNNKAEGKYFGDIRITIYFRNLLNNQASTLRIVSHFF